MQEAKEVIIETVAAHVKAELAGAEGGHDWWHTLRVWRLARHIAEYEPTANLLVVELGALLHDIADSKFHSGDEEIGAIKTRSFLNTLPIDQEIIECVTKIVRHVSWKGGKEKPSFASLELSIVQDADRLDALGAIGVARTFSYGGYKKRELYNPDLEPNLNMTKVEYKNNISPTINHFHEKLFLFKDSMNTQKGSEIAKARHDYMVDFVSRFMDEWENFDIAK